VTARVSPTDRIRAEIDELFATEGDLGEVLEQLARLGARLLLQSALEAEVTEFLGRNRYERRWLARQAKAGSRNGYGQLTVKTTAGPITLERPKLRGTTEAFASRLLGAGVTKTNALESLVIAGFVRGLSVRDVEAALAEALGPAATVSRSTVSRICEAIKDEFDRFKQADLSEVELEYLFLDGSHFKMHAGTKAEPVLVAWGIDTAGKPHLLGLEPGSAESTDAWAEFLRGMGKRGLRPPLLVISDGGAGLIAAVEIVLPASLRQRCLVHRSRKEITCRS
jgi:putative transposase